MKSVHLVFVETGDQGVVLYHVHSSGRGAERCAETLRQQGQDASVSRRWVQDQHCLAD